MAGLKVQRNSYVSCAQGSIHAMNYLSNRVLFFLFSITRAIVKKKKDRKRDTFVPRFLSILAGHSICVIRAYYFIKLLSRSFAQVLCTKSSKSKVSISFVSRKKEKQEESSIGLHFGLIDFK